MGGGGGGGLKFYTTTTLPSKTNKQKTKKQQQNSYKHGASVECPTGISRRLRPGQSGYRGKPLLLSWCQLQVNTGISRRLRPGQSGYRGKPLLLSWCQLQVHGNRRLIRDGSPGRPPPLSHSFCALGESAPTGTAPARDATV